MDKEAKDWGLDKEDILWLGKTFFYEDFEEIWDAGETASMRVAYRTRLEDLMKASILGNTYEHYLTIGERIQIYFNDYDVVFKDSYNKKISITYTQFYKIVNYYIEIYLNKYWCTSSEKNKYKNNLESIYKIARKGGHGSIRHIKKVFTKDSISTLKHNILMRPYKFKLEANCQYKNFNEALLLKKIDELIENPSLVVTLTPTEKIKQTKFMRVAYMKEKDKKYVIELVVSKSDCDYMYFYMTPNKNIVKSLFIDYYKKYTVPDLSKWCSISNTIIFFEKQQKEKELVSEINQTLKVYVNRQLGNPPYTPCLIYDLKKLKILDCTRNYTIEQEKDITDITPLKHCEKLHTLIMPNCKATDYSALSGLTNLKKLNLYKSNIKTLDFLVDVNGKTTPLAENLRTLDISETAIKDFTPLRYCKHLTNLFVKYTCFNNKDILKELKELKYIDLKL